MPVFLSHYLGICGAGLGALATWAILSVMLSSLSARSTAGMAASCWATLVAVLLLWSG